MAWKITENLTISSQESLEVGQMLPCFLHVPRVQALEWQLIFPLHAVWEDREVLSGS